jgi:hypothetical protein
MPIKDLETMTTLQCVIYKPHKIVRAKDVYETKIIQELRSRGITIDPSASKYWESKDPFGDITNKLRMSDSERPKEEDLLFFRGYEFKTEDIPGPEVRVILSDIMEGVSVHVIDRRNKPANPNLLLKSFLHLYDIKN